MDTQQDLEAAEKLPRPSGWRAALRFLIPVVLLALVFCPTTSSTVGVCERCRLGWDCTEILLIPITWGHKANSISDWTQGIIGSHQHQWSTRTQHWHWSRWLIGSSFTCGKLGRNIDFLEALHSEAASGKLPEDVAAALLRKHDFFEQQGPGNYPGLFMGIWRQHRQSSGDRLDGASCTGYVAAIKDLLTWNRLEVELGRALSVRDGGTQLECPDKAIPPDAKADAGGSVH